MRLVHPQALAIRTAEGDWSYGRLKDLVDRLCGVLACDMRVEPGNRVLLRAGNSVMLYAAWLAVARVGAVVVATMPLLRRRELATIVDKARIRHALCEVRLAAELGGLEGPDGRLRTLTWGDGELESRLATQPTGIAAVDTAQDDPCLLAFTSGTTGQPKATVHFHRDVLAMADTFAAHLLSAAAGRCVHRHPAACLHLRSGRRARVSTALRRCDGGDDGADAGSPARGNHPLRRHARLHGTHGLPRPARAGRDAGVPFGTLVRLRRRASAATYVRCLAAGDRSSHHRRHRRHRDDPHLHLRVGR